MWKKEDAKGQSVSEIPTTSAPLSHSPVAPSFNATPAVSSKAAACISQGIRIKGEVTGSEDLFVDGTVEGKLSLTNGSLTIGPNGHVKADVTAREVIVRGSVDGKVTGQDKVQLWSTGRINGEVQTERLAIEEGALLRGKVEAGKPPAKGFETRAAAASASGKSDSISVSSGTAAD